MYNNLIDDLKSSVNKNYGIALKESGLWFKYPWKLLEFFNRINIVESGCWLFKENLKGYGKMNWQLEGRSYIGGHRVAFVLFNGHIDEIDGAIKYHSDLVCHSVNCNSSACGHPMHLRLGTHQNNMHDSMAAGTHSCITKDNSGSNNPSAKLCEEDIIIIRELFNTQSVIEIAATYGVSVGTIYNVKNGKNWNNI